MIFEELEVSGAYVIRTEPRKDERGHFARLWCADELAAKGLVGEVVQINSGFNPQAGTLRGMHLQLPPHAEVKIAMCTRGAVFDVLVDLRRGSPTYRRWAGRTLTPDGGAMLYIPHGCAHGYLTLEADTELSYLTSHRYAAASARGVRHDDPAFGIRWPAKPVLVSAADAGWPDFVDAAAVDLPGATA